MHTKPVNKVVLAIVVIVIVAMLYNAYGAWRYTADNFDEFIRLVLEHLFLVVASMGPATLIGVFIGILITRKRFSHFAPFFLAIVNVWQSIPSLGVIALAYGFLPVFGISGIGVVPGLMALFFQAVAPIVRNTYAGIRSIDPDMLEAATGMGMTSQQVLWKIEFSNALPVIMGGIRTSTALVVGTAPLAFLIGAGGLGFWIFTGIRLLDTGIMIAGAVPVALMAMSLDILLGQLENMTVSEGVCQSARIL